MTEKNPEDNEISKDVNDIEALTKKIDQASSNAGKTYLIYIGFLAYSALTIAGVSDVQLILDNERVNLPIVNIDIALDTFFIIAPILSILMFIYLQLYINRLYSLDRVFPKIGVSNYQRLYPWWMIDIAGEIEEGALKKLQKAMSVFSLWLLLPVTLCIIAMMVIQEHEWFYSYYAIVMILVGSFCVLWFWSRYDSKKVESKFSILDIFRLLRQSKTRSIFTVAMFLFVCFLSIIIPWANRGAPLGSFRDLPIAKFISSAVNLDLSYEHLVVEPKIKENDVYWAYYQGINLKGANLSSSVLMHADLSFAQLQNARLYRTVFQGANLEGANLEGAYLGGADLWGVNLKGANLEGANLEGADLGLANLEGANLEIAILEGANLSEANLAGANLEGANLAGANLEGADLGLANLEGANLSEANLEGANLDFADLRGANLEGAENITSDQLCEAYTLYEAQLDSELQEKVEEKCHKRLEKRQRLSTFKSQA